MSFNFGTPATAPVQSTAAPAFSFGAPPAKAAAPLAFGAAATTSAAAPPAFGAASTTSAAPAFGGFGAAATSAAAPTLGFGAAAASTAPTLGFGAATTSAAPALGGFGAATSAPTLSFGAAAATSAPTLGGFGAPSATSTPAFGGFGSSTTATASAAPTLGGFGAATSTAASAAPASVGLGGSTSVPGGLGGSAPGAAVGQGASGAAQDPGKVGKESSVPQVLATTIDELKAFIKEEKDVSSEVSHLSDKQFKRIKSDTEGLSQLVSVLATGVQQSKARLDRLKMETGQELVNAEIAVRTRDTPTSMQYENTAPTEYFQRLISQFEGQMQSYRKQIEQTEQHLQVLGSGSAVTSEDIVAAVQKLHAAFTDLAAKYQGLHQALAAQKASYRQLHRSLHGTAPVFETKEGPRKPAQATPLPSLSGPSPFSAPTDPLVQARNSLLSRSQAGPPTMPLGTAAPTATFGSLGTSLGASASTPAFGAGNSTFGTGGGFVNPSNTTFGVGNSSTGGFGSNTTFGGGFGATSTFGAASPIAGNKRNKH